MKQANAGFTLVEMLVALFIFAVVTAAGVAIITFGIDAKERTANSADRLKELQVARALLKADLARAVARPTRDAYGGRRALAFRGGVNERTGPTVLRLVRRGASTLVPGEAVSLQAVRYEFTDGTLYRVTRPRLDPTPQTPENRRAVLTGLENLDLSFFVGNAWQPTIGAVAAGNEVMPQAVALEANLAGIGRLRQLFLVGGGS